MIRINISTIKQYFWYFDNFNKTHKIEDKYIIPVLKIKEKYYIFHNNKTQIFDENFLLNMNFISYDKQYSYKAIDETIERKKIILDFHEYICVFIIVDEMLKWEIEKNDILKKNDFYIQSILNNKLLQIKIIVKKEHKDVVFSQSPLQHNSLSSIDQENIFTKKLHETSHETLHETSHETSHETLHEFSHETLHETLHEISHENLHENLHETYMSEEPIYSPPIPDPFWEDIVFV